MARPTDRSRASKLFGRFRDGQVGGVAVTIGLALPVVMGLVGVAVDYSTWTAQKARLQKAADQAALATTQELRVGNPTEARIKAVADSIVQAQIRLSPGDGPVTVTAVPTRGSAPDKTDSAEAKTSSYNGVRITLAQRKNAVMSRLVTPQLTDMQVSATARIAGGAKICVIGLDETATDTIRFVDSAKISAGGCSVYANSTSPAAIRSENSATVTSMLTCSAGGYRQSTSNNFQPRCR